MITHLASLSGRRLIISFAPWTPAYAVLKRIGELFPGPSKVRRHIRGWLPFDAWQSHLPGSQRHARLHALPLCHQLTVLHCPRYVQHHAHAPPAPHAAPHVQTHVVPRPPSSASHQATRAYLHAESNVEAALQRAGFTVINREMTATSFYFSRLLEAVRQ